MEQKAPEQENIRLYLLGLLPQEEQQPLEESLLTDAALYEELLIVEDELIDQYLAGELTGRERDAFEAHFINAPERRQQVRFADTLRRYVADKGAVVASATTAESSEVYVQGATTGRQSRSLVSWLSTRNPALAFSLAAAALVLVCGLSWIAVRTLRPRAPGQVLTVMLTPDIHTRSGGDVQQVSIPAGTDAVRLQLRLTSDEFQTYSATLLDSEGATISTTDNLKPETAGGVRNVILSVPARAVPPGEYQLKLKGVNADGKSETAESYRFRIEGR
jgi:hypothetical protein